MREFLRDLSDADLAAVVAAMKEVAVDGLVAARHLRGDIYEVRADGERVTYRRLFATEGRLHQVLLGLAAFGKKTQTTPLREIALADETGALALGRGRLAHLRSEISHSIWHTP